MPTSTQNLIPAENSTFNAPGFWDFSGQVEIGGGAAWLADGAYIGKHILTPGRSYLGIVELGDAQPNTPGAWFNVNVGEIINGESRTFNAPGRYEFRFTANGDFFGAIMNSGTAIINALEVYPLEAYATPAASTTPPPQPMKRKILPLVIGLGIVWAIFGRR